MAEQSDVLKEFLVKIGYHVDTKSQRQADNTIQNTTAVVNRLGAAMAAAGAAVAAGTAKVSGYLNNLGYISERTDSSAASIRAMQLAAENLGSSGAEATSAIEGLYQQIREQPGTENILQRLGVETRNANGELRSSVDLLGEFAAKTRDMPMYRFQAFADTLNIPQRLRLAMREEDFTSYLDEFRERAQDLGFDAATQKAQELRRQVNEVRNAFENMGIVATASFQESVEPLLDRLTEWAETDGVDLADQVGDQTERLIEYGDSLLRWYDKANDFTEDLSRWFFNAQESVQETSLARGFAPWLTDTMRDWGNYFGITDSSESESSGRSNPGTSDEQRKRRDTAMRYFMGEGWSKAQASGMVANLEEESNLDIRARGDRDENGVYQAQGIAQWHPERRQGYYDYANEAGIFPGFGHSSFTDQLGYILHELENKPYLGSKDLRGSMSPEQAARVFATKYERHGGGEAENIERMERARRIYSETTINVNGVQDPQAVAERVESTRRNSEQAAVRNNGSVAR